MKKILMMIFVGIIAFGLMSCQTTKEPTQETNQRQTTNSSKTLIVYYSATKNTETTAKMIAEETNGDLFVIEPKVPYTADDLDWTDNNSRVSLEHDGERNVELVSTTVDHWNDYDTFFIGYPIWWGIAAWPVDSFVKENDFTGKTVIPFCTSASSDLGQSGELLADMAKGGKWQNGQRFQSHASASEVHEWLEQLGFSK